MSEYRFVSHWRVEGTVVEVYSIIENVTSLPEWWPSVYLRVAVVEPGDAEGAGKIVDLYTKGWLPYTLRWRLRVTGTNRPYGSSIVASGDLTGQGHWTFEQDGPDVNITYYWIVIADKPLLRWLAFFLKPVFAANHRWAMSRGEESLKLELLRRRLANSGERTKIPDPPGPTFPHSLSYRRRRKE